MKPLKHSGNPPGDAETRIFRRDQQPPRIALAGARQDAKNGPGAVIAESEREQVDVQEKLSPPALYRVVMLNDDYTPMDFVVAALRRFFHKDLDEATELMLQIHYSGSAICGIYPLDVAETKAAQVMESARQKEHPLCCILEQD